MIDIDEMSDISIDFSDKRPVLDLGDAGTDLPTTDVNPTRELLYQNSRVRAAAVVSNKQIKRNKKPYRAIAKWKQQKKLRGR